MIRQNELMNVRCSERGSLLGIKIYSPSSECLIECVDIPEHLYKWSPARIGPKSMEEINTARRSNGDQLLTAHY